MKNRPKPMNITPAQKSLGLFIFIGNLLQRRAQCSMRPPSQKLRASALNLAVYRIAVLSTVLLFGLTACGDRAKPEPLPANAAALAFGCRPTFRSRSNETECYPAQLERR